MRTQRGFSLVELLIVVAIIGIVAAIAIPSLIKSRRAAEEASAIGTMRSYGSAQLTYFATQGNLTRYGLAADLVDGYIEPVIILAPTRNNYRFTFSVAGDRLSYTATANPTDTPSGSRFFFIDHSTVIRYNWDTAADSTSSVLGT